MPTLSVQQMPNGFEVQTPSFWYWMTAGIAFTIGAGAVSVLATVVRMWLMTQVPVLMVLRSITR